LDPVAVDLLLEVVLHHSALAIDILIEIRHPNHHQLILRSCREVIPLLIELNSLDLPLMPEHRPPQPPLFEIPNLDLAIIRHRRHMVPIRMERQPINGTIMRIIVLDQLPQTSIPQLDSPIDR